MVENRESSPCVISNQSRVCTNFSPFLFAAKNPSFRDRCQQHLNRCFPSILCVFASAEKDTLFLLIKKNKHDDGIPLKVVQSGCCSHTASTMKTLSPENIASVPNIWPCCCSALAVIPVLTLAQVSMKVVRHLDSRPCWLRCSSKTARNQRN